MNDKNRIKNHVEVTHALTTHQTLLPEGDYKRVRVDNQMFDYSAPEILRVAVDRKGDCYNIIEKAREFGLQVGDVWQHDRDKKADNVMLKLEPQDE